MQERSCRPSPSEYAVGKGDATKIADDDWGIGMSSGNPSKRLRPIEADGGEPCCAQKLQVAPCAASKIDHRCARREPGRERREPSFH
jgi:hypothetical protein